MNLIYFKAKDLLRYHCGHHGNIITIVVRYVADPFSPKKGSYQIWIPYKLGQRSKKVLQEYSKSSPKVLDGVLHSLFSARKMSASYLVENFKLRLGSNWRKLLVQHDVTVDHTMLSRVAKLCNLQCSTTCDNVCWTMLKGYVKLTYICWTTNQIYIVIIFSQFFIRKDSSVDSTLAS